MQMAAIIVTLRREAEWEILESGIGATVTRISDLRGAVEDAPTEPTPIPPGAPALVDSVQN